MDERWGDWRPHLAMILSNQSSRHELDRKSITTLGDTLGKGLKMKIVKERRLDFSAF